MEHSQLHLHSTHIHVHSVCSHCSCAHGSRACSSSGSANFSSRSCFCSGRGDRSGTGSGAQGICICLCLLLLHHYVLLHLLHFRIKLAVGQRVPDLPHVVLAGPGSAVREFYIPFPREVVRRASASRTVHVVHSLHLNQVRGRVAAGNRSAQLRQRARAQRLHLHLPQHPSARQARHRLHLHLQCARHAQAQVCTR